MAEITIPEHKWYQIIDYFTSIDELLRKAVIPLLEDIDKKITVPEEYVDALAEAIAEAIQNITINIQTPNITVSQSPNLISLLIDNKLKVSVVDKRDVSVDPNGVEVLYTSYSDKVIVPFMMISVNNKNVQIIRKMGSTELVDTIEDLYSTIMNINDNDLYLAMYDESSSVYTVVLSPQATPFISDNGFRVEIRNTNTYDTIRIIREKIIAYEVIE